MRTDFTFLPFRFLGEKATAETHATSQIYMN